MPRPSRPLPRSAAALALLVVVLAGAGCGDGAPARPAARPAPGASARVVAERHVAPRVLDLTVRSRALGRTAQVRLLTPRGWSAHPRRHWPVLWLLHGCCDTYDSWARSTDVARLRALRDVLVVLPEGGAVGFYSDWRNGGRGGAPAWETFHLRELRGLLERDFGAGRRRAIAGLSMGGLGAMAYAARHPGVFGAAASFSGLVHPRQHAAFLLGLMGAFTPDARAVWGDPAGDRATWAAHDPTALAARLRGTRLFVASGDGRPGPFDRRGRPRDGIEATVGAETRSFVRRLRALRVRARTDLYGPGTHTWPYWRRELHRALPTLLRALHGRSAPRVAGGPAGGPPR